MKNVIYILATIGLAFILLLGIGKADTLCFIGSEEPIQGEGVADQYITSQSLADVESCFCMPKGREVGEIATIKLHSLARHMRTMSCRMQWFTQSNKVFAKTLVRYLSRIVSFFTATDRRVYTTVKIPYWELPSECYVFGIRHILI